MYRGRCRVIIEGIVVLFELFKRLLLMNEHPGPTGQVDGEQGAEEDDGEEGPDHPVEESAEEPEVGVEGQEEVGDAGHGALLHRGYLGALPHL